MKKVKNNIPIIVLLLHLGLCGQSSEKIIARQGQVSFFSYTSVENIEAANNQTFSVIETETGAVGVKLLLRAFVFKKALMEEHFNESYVESDLYPELNFRGKFMDYNGMEATSTPKLIKGSMDFHGVTKEVQIKTVVSKENENFVVTGDFVVNIDDYNIKVPPLLTPNISKEIQVKFRFQYEQYEEL